MTGIIVPYRGFRYLIYRYLRVRRAHQFLHFALEVALETIALRISAIKNTHRGVATMANQPERPDRDQSRQGSDRTVREFGTQPKTPNRGADKSPTSRSEEIGQDDADTESENMSGDTSSRRELRQDSKKPF